MTGNNLAYLTVFLNSSIFKFSFKDYFPELLGESREMRKVFFEKIVIKEVEDEGWFEEILKQIEANKRNGISTKDLEHRIDNKLFSIYELSESECSIISKSLDVERISPLSKVLSKSVIE